MKDDSMFASCFPHDFLGTIMIKDTSKVLSILQPLFDVEYVSYSLSAVKNYRYQALILSTVPSS